MAGQEPQTTGAETGEPPRTSIEDHKRTYDAFMGFTKWGTLIVAVILIGLLVFLV
ncbi:MAG: aa3-type cytochrome c oxidase subunit IV [Pseudomonadota bacterium]